MELKNELFNEITVRGFYSSINKEHKIRVDELVERALHDFEDLELKQRISYLTEQLYDALQLPFDKAINLFDKVMLNKSNSGFTYGAILEYLEVYGCNDEFHSLAISRLGEYTENFSAEFAIRSFINEYEKETVSYVKQWSNSENVHKRRLASEGTRPKLPWAKKISLNYEKSIEWLDNLYLDDERYVIRSVANHLNDISKLDSQLVIKTLKRWKKTRLDREMHYLIHHSLRSLIKKGDKDALIFIGYKADPKVDVSNINIELPAYKGSVPEFNSTISFSEDARVIIDYVLWYQSKSGRPSKKVYKLTQINGKEGRVYPITGKLSLKERTTRKIYLGLHKIELQVNGKVLKELEFEVLSRKR